MNRDALVALLHIYQTTSFDPPTVDINYIRTYLRWCTWWIDQCKIHVHCTQVIIISACICINCYCLDNKYIWQTNPGFPNISEFSEPTAITKPDWSLAGPNSKDWGGLRGSQWEVWLVFDQWWLETRQKSGQDCVSGLWWWGDIDIKWRNQKKALIDCLSQEIG